MIKITYKKNDGSTIYRLRTTMLPYKIGETTSMGWEVLNIEYEYKNKYYSLNEYNIINQKKKKILLKKQQTINVIIQEIKSLLYYIIATMLINLFRIIV